MTRIPLTDDQHRAWLEAQQLWGVQLHGAQAEPDAGAGSFAWFSFPPSITIDPVLAAATGADRELATVFAHEIGHHVLAPSTRRTSLAMTHQLARALTASSATPVPRLAAIAALASNLWSDLLINSRVVDLQRRSDPHREPGMIRLWRILRSESNDPLFWVILRACEELWGLPDGSICATRPPGLAQLAVHDSPIAVADPITDAPLLAQTARTFADDPVRGALRFGMIAAPYLLAGHLAPSGCGGDETGTAPTAAELGEVLRDPRLAEEPVHPAVGTLADARKSAPGTGVPSSGGGQGYGLAETLTLYSSVPEQTVLTAWYLDRARPYVRPYRQPDTGADTTDLVGAMELWELGDDLADIDWPQTLVASPHVVPGITTRRRGVVAEDAQHVLAPVELDLYIDSSGSMPHPTRDSPALLAGTILIASTLAGGGRVRVTSFSGPTQVAGTPRMTANRTEAMSALLTFFAGGTTFPLDLLAARYRAATAGARRHLVVLSDEGLESFFGSKQPGLEHVAIEVRPLLDTATLVLLDPRRSTADAAAAAGYDVEYLDSIEDAPAACAALARRIAEPQGAEHG